MKLKKFLFLILVILIGLLIIQCPTQNSSSGSGGKGGDGGSDEDYTASNFQNIWTNLSPSDKPDARYGHVMVYVENNKIILFGGTDGSPNDETWEYNIITNNWIDLDITVPITTRPSARNMLAMVYTGNNRAILFGGAVGVGTFSDQTWSYDVINSKWELLAPTISPPGSVFYERSGHAMVYAGNNKIILFGGVISHSGSTLLSNETWSYDISTNTWALLNPAPKPSERYLHSMVYTGNNKIILFGGIVIGGASNNEIWEYDINLNTWTEISSGAKPPARNGHTMVYTENNKIILFGGNDISSNNETWEYDIVANIWNELTDPAATNPSARSVHSMVYTGNYKIILFGGYNGSPNEETWLYE